MVSVGERLRLERETRNTTIDEMAAATGIGRSYLDSLESSAYHALPGPAFGKLYIRAYAEVLGFDPQPWIDDYDREQRLVQGASSEPTPSAPSGSRPVAAALARWKESRAAERPEPVVEPAAEDAEIVPDAAPQQEQPIHPAVVDVITPEPHLGVPTAKRFVAPLLLAGAFAVALAIYWGLRGAGGDQGATPMNATPTNAAPPPVAPVQESRPPDPPPPRVAESKTTPPPKPGALAVTEFGVGRRIVSLRLEGETDRFAPGERVYFASRVVGGKRGDLIRHVWLYEGRVQQTITLRLGGADFRTHSNKTLGHAGEWAVEARDARGAVLARATFKCVAAG